MKKIAIAAVAAAIGLTAMATQRFRGHRVQS